MKNRNKKIILYVSAFLIPALIVAAIMAANSIVPFGSERTVCWVDADGQYISYFSYYKQILSGQQSPLFSFAKLIGGDMAGMFAYYLLSPFNFILLLFSTADMPRAIAVLGILKIGRSGITSAIYLSHHIDDNSKVLLLSSAYALMAYNIIYLPNIMWLDGVILLPLIALGIDCIWEKKSSLTYIVFLTTGIFINYYIGFMLCMASVLYFVYICIKQCENLKEFFVVSIRYAIGSIVSGLLNMAIIIPVLYSLQGTSKSTLPLNQLIGLSTQRKFSELIKHLIFPQVTMNDMSTMLPNVFVGVVITGLCILFIIHPKIKFREKAAVVFAGIVMLLSFYFTTPYYLWHGFAAPVCFEYRFAFVASFFMIIAAGRILKTIRMKNMRVVLLILLNNISLFYYGNLNYTNAGLPANKFKDFVLETQPAVDYVKNIENDGNFYRIEKDFRYSYNDAMTLGYNGLTHYSSGEKLITRKALQSAGYAFTEQYGFYGNGSTVAADSMFSIKYLLFKDRVKAGYDKILDLEDICVYTNPYSWSPAIKADKSITELEFSDITRGLMPQQILKSAWGAEYGMTGVIKDTEIHTVNLHSYQREDGLLCYSPENGEKGYLEYSFIAPDDTNLYIIMIGENNGKIGKITTGNSEIKGYPNTFDHGVRYLRQIEKGKKVTVSIEVKEEIALERLDFLYDNFRRLDNVSRLMETNSYKEKDFDGDSFSVSGVMDETEGLLLMIPYHNGWNIEVNGVKADYLPVLDNFVYVPIEKGQFTLQVSFTPPGLYIGAGISLIALIIGIVFIKAEKKYLK